MIAVVLLKLYCWNSLLVQAALWSGLICSSNPSKTMMANNVTFQLQCWSFASDFLAVSNYYVIAMCILSDCACTLLKSEGLKLSKLHLNNTQSQPFPPQNILNLLSRIFYPLYSDRCDVDRYLVWSPFFRSHTFDWFFRSVIGQDMSIMDLSVNHRR